MSSMDGQSSSNPETQSQSAPAAPVLCRAGCGFYAHSSFDGMCSKCYKAKEISRTAVTTITASAASNAAAAISDEISACTDDSSSVDTNSLPSLDTALPTVPSTSSLTKCKDSDKNSDSDVSEISEADQSDASSTSSARDKTKKNRCSLCKKKVGLTGFNCRCGGQFCSIHRYSDTHKCSFNYRELAQTEIRKHNPVVAAEKVKKL